MIINHIQLAFFTCMLLMPVSLSSQSTAPEADTEKLVVLWTSGDSEVAEKVALMYTHAAKTQGWFKEVTLIVWGPSQKLVLDNQKIRSKVDAMKQDGILVEACIACSDSYGITEQLRTLGYTVKGMGKPLTAYLKSSARVITF